jgi:membrane protease subunit (stomatin/prohibitin family)
MGYEILYRDGLLNAEAPTLAELVSNAQKPEFFAECGCGFETKDKNLSWCPKCKQALLWQRINHKDKRRRR